MNNIIKMAFISKCTKEKQNAVSTAANAIYLLMVELGYQVAADKTDEGYPRLIITAKYYRWCMDFKHFPTESPSCLIAEIHGLNFKTNTCIYLPIRHHMNDEATKKSEINDFAFNSVNSMELMPKIGIVEHQINAQASSN